jgi:hypothetical protein
LKTNKLYYFGGLATCVSSALVSHTKLPIPPALLIWGAMVLLFLFLYLSDFGSSRIPKYGLIILPFAFFLLFTQPFTDASLKNYVGPIISALFFPLVVYFLNFLNRNQVVQIVKYLLLISTIVLTFETLYRYVFPNFELQDLSESRGSDDMFYMFKTTSLMYNDSNGAAIHISIILFFTYYWSEFVEKKYRFIKFVLWVLLIFSISRAAWIGAIIGLIYFKLLRGKSILFWTLAGSLFFLFSLIGFFVYILPLMETDPSFMARIEVFESAYKYYKSGPNIIDQLTGIGVYMSKEYFDIYLHNFYIVQAVEMGFISLALLIIMWGQFIFFTNSKGLIILVPYSIIVLSSTLSFIPVFYVVMGIMCICENKFKIIE